MPPCTARSGRFIFPDTLYGHACGGGLVDAPCVAPMSDTLLFNLGFALVGLLLIVMTLSSSLISRVPFSSAILYLAVGVGIGPWGLGLLVLDPVDDAHLI